ncbi:hypothetical protein ACJIZ3_020533 [Penstemon smallii]|uniref:S-adenosylmethionine-dependent methyltransferase n=1 Tax=Penstemon smallii TaxID=265156 RepID=A0ABD3SIZ8_9LAMI
MNRIMRGVVDVARALIEEEIAKKLDIKQLIITSGVINSNTFCIADFGCSTGHNSLISCNKKLFPAPADFQVFFNDQVVNDFNTLFKSLPPERPYHAAGLPGTFHGRLLPKKSLHFAYSSCALHWLSETKDYANHQFAKDIQSFLEARADEVVDGGLMALLVPALPNHFNINSESAGYTYQTAMRVKEKKFPFAKYSIRLKKKRTFKTFTHKTQNVGKDHLCIQNRLQHKLGHQYRTIIIFVEQFFYFLPNDLKIYSTKFYYTSVPFVHILIIHTRLSTFSFTLPLLMPTATPPQLGSSHGGCRHQTTQSSQRRT